MAQTASQRKGGVEGKMLYVAFELGWTSWRLGFCTRLDEKAWVATIGARDVAAMKKTIAKARARFGVSADVPGGVGLRRWPGRLLAGSGAGRDGGVERGRGF